MVTVIGFIVLPITALVLYSVVLKDNVAAYGISGLVSLQLILLIGLLYGINGERKKEIEKEFSFRSTDGYNFVAILAGTLLTFIFNNHLGMGSVVASALVATISAIIIPKFAVPLHCGSIVGMASCLLFETHTHIAVAGMIAGAVFILSKNTFNGFGGKLGASALTGCILASVFAGKGFLTGGIISGWDIEKYFVFYSVVAAVVTYILNIRLKHGPVFSSGIVGLLGGLIMPALFPEIGNTLAVMVICASYAGMSSRDRIPNEIYIAIVGLLTAFFFIWSIPYFGGTGGKLGTIAFISCIIIRGFLDIFDFASAKK